VAKGIFREKRCQLEGQDAHKAYRNARRHREILNLADQFSNKMSEVSNARIKIK